MQDTYGIPQCNALDMTLHFQCEKQTWNNEIWFISFLFIIWITRHFEISTNMEYFVVFNLQSDLFCNNCHYSIIFHSLWFINLFLFNSSSHNQTVAFMAGWSTVYSNREARVNWGWHSKHCLFAFCFFVKLNSSLLPSEDWFMACL